MKKNLVIVAIIVLASNLFAAEIVKNSSELEKKSGELYSEKDKVLYNLDSGMLNYYEGNYSVAIEKLTEAENLIYDYYTKSISQNAAAFVTNDSVIEYPGEDYEDIYTNLFKAISYYKAGKWEEGFHEVNAYQRKAGAVALRHNDELLMARQAAKVGQLSDVNVSFHDSALGEYLFLLYYRSIFDENQVQYSARMLKDVFTTSSDIYNFSVPFTIDDEVTTKKSDARLNFVIFSGKSPIKVENTEYYSNELILSLPELEIEKPKVRFITVEATNKNTGKKYTQNLEQIEDFGNICTDVFKSRSKVIYYKSLARAMTKAGTTAGSKIAGEVLSDSDNTALSLLGNALSVASIANENATNETEHADLRHSNYFPGRADVGGLTVEPGMYDVKVSYFGSKDGKILYEEKVSNVNVSAGKMNLVSTSSTLKEIQDSPSPSTSAGKITVADAVDRDKILFDIGTEPEASASSTFAFLQYNRNENFGSNIKFIYSTATETESEIAGYTNGTLIQKNNEFELDLLPVVFYFGENKKFNLSVGVSYQYIYEKVFAGMFDTNGLMLDSIDKGKYFTMDNERSAHIFAPRVGFSSNIPLLESLNLNFQFYANPIYFLNLTQNMKYHSDQTVYSFNYYGDNSVSKWSSPYIDARVALDCSNYVRFVTQLSYQRLDFQQMDWAEDFESLVGYDDVQSITKFRFGLELLAGSKKKARVRGGIYYQGEWSNSSYMNETTMKNKFIISIGSER